jgi:hypothetical protein
MALKGKMVMIAAYAYTWGFYSFGWHGPPARLRKERALRPWAD